MHAGESNHLLHSQGLKWTRFIFWGLCRVWNLSLNSVQLRSDLVSISRSCARFQPQLKADLKILRMKKNLSPHLKQGSNLGGHEPGLTFRQHKCLSVQPRHGEFEFPRLKKTQLLISPPSQLYVLLSLCPIGNCQTSVSNLSPRMYVAWILYIHNHLWLTMSMTRFVGPMWHRCPPVPSSCSKSTFVCGMNHIESCFSMIDFVNDPICGPHSTCWMA